MKIITIADTANITNPLTFEVEDNTNLLDWLIGYYGPDGFSVPTQIFTGHIAKNTLLDNDNDLNREITENIFIIQRPQGADPLSIFAIAFIVSLVVSVAVAALMPTPELPENTRTRRKSQNNALAGQTNIARPLDRVPDIFGTDKSFPDLIAPTTQEYINNVLFNTEYMCVSRGFLDITDVRSGDTLVENIIGSSVQIFEPGQSPTEVLKTVVSNEVKTLTLNPPNDAGVKLTANTRLAYDSINDYGIITGADKAAWEDYGIGSVVTLTDVYIDSANELSLDEQYVVAQIYEQNKGVNGFLIDYVPASNEGIIYGDFSAFIDESVITIVNGWTVNPLNLRLDGTYVVKSADTTKIVLNSVANVNRDWTGLQANASFDNVNDSRVTQDGIALNAVSTVVSDWTDPSFPQAPLQLLTITENRVLDPRSQLPNEASVRGPFIVPDNNNDEIWLDFRFPRGLVNDNNKNYTVDIKVTFEEIDSNDDPVGPLFEVEYSFTDNVLDVLNFTRKVTSADGLDNTKRYRVSAERTSNTSPNDVDLQDQIQWTRLAGITDITTADTTGTTRIQIKTQATEQTASLQNREFNMIAQRKVVTYSGGSVVGDIQTGVGLTASNRMADIFLHYCLDQELAARDISQVDADAIYAIQAELDGLFGGKLGEFNYTFDNQNTPAIEELRQIANAARCFVFRDGSVLSMVRDQSQPVSRALFNRRNKKPESESKTVRFNKPLDNDGVQVEFKDRDRGYKNFTITLPNDLQPGDPNYGQPNTVNPLKIEVTGVTNEQQAWNRAQYEYNKLIHSRVAVETTVTEEAILLPLNARIDHVDGTTLARTQSNGEVESFAGLTCTTSERCIFEAGKTYSVILRNDVGEPDAPIPVTARTDTEFGFVLSYAPSFSLFVRGDNDYQVGTLYNFAPDGDEVANQYLVQRKTPNDEGNVTLELINYSEKYYQADAQPAPARRAFSQGYDEGYQ